MTDSKYENKQKKGRLKSDIRKWKTIVKSHRKPADGSRNLNNGENADN